MRVVTSVDIHALIHDANLSPRRRSILRLHESDDPVQRMVNAILPGSYITPHRYENPPRPAFFSILTGRVAVLQFSTVGVVEEVTILEYGGLNVMAEVPPGVYYTLLALEPSALLDVIHGPHEAPQHIKYASWSPLEENHYARDFYMYLVSIVHNRTAAR